MAYPATARLPGRVSYGVAGPGGSSAFLVLTNMSIRGTILPPKNLNTRAIFRQKWHLCTVFVKMTNARFLSVSLTDFQKGTEIGRGFIHPPSLGRGPASPRPFRRRATASKKAPVGRRHSAFLTRARSRWCTAVHHRLALHTRRFAKNLAKAKFFTR